ncbi:heme ABC transporter ATP-binding protein [Allosediminivita pacifica]|uniref:Iron complex transport system ATP-binding protein n=1 Tax=Allosediminivita pacifica TaxID=1267769 RepID=A0A2T6APA7_9RHOB|nr:heme ABC transporter ATP-binding protein [Allosediminivita pacifica]PTX45653.1 iron complex transport system ATP-binding protein [Allosediminivita pacifica]GGB06930.1 hemin import ATP-binding protein HmuV [Allosediminivita pacifica]
MLSATGIEVRYGDHLALRGIDFRARAGEVSAIVGPNGSGKTSLLGAITATVPYRGAVMLNGRDIAGQRPWELAAQRAVLPQAARLAFPFTVLEVVRLGLQAGTSGARDEVPMLALSRVGMTEHAGRSFQDLSGGEAQRVMLARVLAQVWAPVADGQPRWLLLDEPVASLDIAHQLQVMDLARDFARAGGGVVAVMHDLNLTALYSDAVTVLSRGRCLASGHPRDVMTDDTLSEAYGCSLRVSVPPAEGLPYILPQSAAQW